jgi:hypothetical protein
MKLLLATLLVAFMLREVECVDKGFGWNEMNCSSSLHVPLNPTELVNDKLSPSLSMEDRVNHHKCPPWYFYDVTKGTCNFTYPVKGRVSYVMSTLQTVVLQCYCMTNDSETRELALSACPYTCLVDAGYYSLPCKANTVENFTCARFKRTGLSCGECAPGHAPPIYSYTSHCVPCSRSNSAVNWIKYLTVAFVPLTLFTLCVIVLQIKATSPYLFSYIFFVQTIALTVNVRLVQMLLETGKIDSKGVVKFGITLASLWNLDFFRMYYSPFCLHPSLNTLVVNFMDTFIALYPFVLIAFLALLVKLGLGRTRICKAICKPINFLCHYYGIEWDMSSNLISAFATFILLSNEKIVSVAFDMLMPAYIYPMDESTPKRLHVLSSGSTKYFGAEHTPLALFSILFVIIFVVVPMLLLLFYPFGFFRFILRKLHLDSNALRSIANHFHGSYKSKEEDGSECRWFPVTYFVLRIVLMLLYGATLSSFFFPIEGVVLTAFVVFLAVCRPRKSEVHNAIDIFHIMSFLIFILGIMADITASSQTKRKEFLRTSVFIIAFASALPFLYIVSLVGYCAFYRIGVGRKVKQILLRIPIVRRWFLSRKGYERIDYPGENFDPLPDRFERDDGSDTHILTRKSNSYSSIVTLNDSGIN